MASVSSDSSHAEKLSRRRALLRAAQISGASVAGLTFAGSNLPPIAHAAISSEILAP